MTTYPIQIDSGHGQVLIFERLVPRPDEGRLEVSSIVQPKAGPPMHVHYLQDEGMTVGAGRMGHQIAGEQPRSVNVGESVAFKREVAHRSWAEGDQPLHASGYAVALTEVQRRFLVLPRAGWPSAAAGRAARLWTSTAWPSQPCWSRSRPRRPGRAPEVTGPHLHRAAEAD